MGQAKLKPTVPSSYDANLGNPFGSTQCIPEEYPARAKSTRVWSGVWHCHWTTANTETRYLSGYIYAGRPSKYAFSITIST